MGISSRLMCLRLFLGGTTAAVLALPDRVEAYSTKLHMITGYHIAKKLREGGCKVKLGGWNNDKSGVNLKADVSGQKAEQEGGVPSFLRTMTPRGPMFLLGEGDGYRVEVPPRAGGAASANLARGRSASQSSTVLGGVASRAVDGNRDGTWAKGSVTHTDIEDGAWWQVDLGPLQAGSTRTIASVLVWNRTDCCGERLANFDVRVSDDGSTWINYHVATPGAPSNVTIGRAARYVRIQLRGRNYLSLAEVEVLGRETTTIAPPPSPTPPGDTPAAVSPVGTCEVNANNYAMTLVIRQSTGQSGGGYEAVFGLRGANLLPVDNVSFDAANNGLVFRRTGPGWFQWYKGTVTQTGVAGTFSHESAEARPGPDAFRYNFSGTCSRGGGGAAPPPAPTPTPDPAPTSTPTPAPGDQQTSPAFDDDTYEASLSGEICNLITNPATYQYFVSGTVAPDTFPGMFGNTDPTHALNWNTAWQIPVLWQNAQTPQEKAFVLGWLVHFAGDLNAHGLANMHATGVWMADNNMDTVWKHIVTEVHYAKRLFPYPNGIEEAYTLPPGFTKQPSAKLTDGQGRIIRVGGVAYPRGFNNTLVWPEPFVKRMFFNPTSPLYRHWDYLWSRFASDDAATSIGIVSKAFGGAYRLLFLMWDYFAAEANRWEGRMLYFQPRQKGLLTNFNDWLHWGFANQAYNWFKKKAKAAKDTIDAWYTATHRAQQAVVADDNAVWSGKYRDEYGALHEFRYIDKVFKTATLGYETSDTIDTASAGLGGVMGAYKYLGHFISDLLSPDLFTINQENAPWLKWLIDALNSLGAAGRWVIDQVKKITESFVNFLMAPFRKIAERVKAALLDPIIDELKEKIEDLACEKTQKMKSMCDTIEAQKNAFGITPAEEVAEGERAKALETYLNWPIYRNTITAGVLSLEKLRGLNRSQGNETMSPLFGLPSGDFGCTLGCTAFYRARPTLFMPAAGKYYENQQIKDAFPDYCMARQEARRLTSAVGANRELPPKEFPLNAPFHGRTNNEANRLVNEVPGFTCYTSTRAESSGAGGSPQVPGVTVSIPPPALPFKGGKGSITIGPPLPAEVRASVPLASCKGDSYDAPARRNPLAVQNPRTIGEKINWALGELFDRLSGRWSYLNNTLPFDRKVFVLPRDANDAQVRDGKMVSSRLVTYVSADGKSTGEKSPQAPICYHAYRWDQGTIAPPVPDPMAEHRDLRRVESYSLQEIAKSILDGIKSLLSMALNAAWDFIKGKLKEACKWIEEKVQQAYETIIAGPIGKACADLYCKAMATEYPKCETCYFGSCNGPGPCQWWSGNIKVKVCVGTCGQPCSGSCAWVDRLNVQKHKACVESKCMQWTTKKVWFCPK